MKNLFGEEVSTLDLLDNIKKGRKRYVPMQEIYGKKEGFKCKECKHFIRQRRGANSWFKCALWYVSNSEATDIRANATACKKFEEEKNNE